MLVDYKILSKFLLHFCCQSTNIPHMTTKKTTSPAPTFETAMLELEELVSNIETGNLPLEESLKEFERGIKLSRICQEALTDAEKRVKILSADGTEEEFPSGSE